MQIYAKMPIMKSKKELTTLEENAIILDIIAHDGIGDQQVLGEKMIRRGVEMNQSTLSRRLKNLGIVKKRGVYILPSMPLLDVKGILLRIDMAPPNLMVMHTPPGHGQALAHQLDHMSHNNPESVEKGGEGSAGFSEILGTIAGDDTVLVICKNEKDLRALRKKIDSEWF